MTGEPFTFIQHLPGYSLDVKRDLFHGRDCLTHYFGQQDDPTYLEENSIWHGFSSSSSSSSSKSSSIHDSMSRSLAAVAPPVTRRKVDTDVERDWFMRFGSSIGAIFGGNQRGNVPRGTSRHNEHYDYVSFESTAQRESAVDKKMNSLGLASTKSASNVMSNGSSASSTKPPSASVDATTTTTTTTTATTTTTTMTTIATDTEPYMTKGGFIPSQSGQLYGAAHKGHLGKGGVGVLLNTPMFFHQLKQRKAETFRHMLRITPEQRLTSSACIECTVPPNITDALLFPEKYSNFSGGSKANTKLVSHSKVELIDHGDDLFRLRAIFSPQQISCGTIISSMPLFSFMRIESLWELLHTG